MIIKKLVATVAIAGSLTAGTAGWRTRLTAIGLRLRHRRRPRWSRLRRGSPARRVIVADTPA
jgi:hypothetical protein